MPLITGNLNTRGSLIRLRDSREGQSGGGTNFSQGRDVKSSSSRWAAQCTLVSETKTDTKLHLAVKHFSFVASGLRRAAEAFPACPAARGVQQSCPPGHGNSESSPW